MVEIYTALNVLDAHILCGLLRQAGIEAQVWGEYLQGGIGELPAWGLVRVAVPEDDVEQARALIAARDADDAGEMPT